MPAPRKLLLPSDRLTSFHPGSIRPFLAPLPLEQTRPMRLLDEPAFLSATIGKIYDCALRPEGWRDVMLDLGAVIGARRAFFGTMKPNSAADALVVADVDSVDPDMQTYMPLNPVAPIAMVWPVDKAFVSSRDYGLGPLRASRYYREYLAPRGDLDAMAFVVTRESDRFGHWLLVTQDDRPPITQEEAAGMELVAPHIRRAAEISNVLGAQRLSAETYRAALDQIDSAVLIVDGNRRVVYANPRAGSALAAGTALRIGADSRLRGATDGAERALRRAGAATEGGFEAPVEGTDGEERLLFAVSLDLTREDRLGQAERSTLLVLRSPREDTRNPVVIASRTFGLTPAQVQVLAFLAQGHAPEGIADILGVATSTVKTHLAELFRRTGTARQAELVARALSLASPLRTGPLPEGKA